MKFGGRKMGSGYRNAHPYMESYFRLDGWESSGLFWKVEWREEGKFGYRNAHPYMESYFRLDGWESFGLFWKVEWRGEGMDVWKEVDMNNHDFSYHKDLPGLLQLGPCKEDKNVFSNTKNWCCNVEGIRVKILYHQSFW